MKYGFPVICLILLMTLSGYSNAFWVLQGTITDASNCEPLQGVNISSSLQNFNISQNNGQYSLDLLSGNWTITAVKINYSVKNFTTPFIFSGGYTYNFSLLQDGMKPYNCSDQGYHNENAITEITRPTITTSTIATTSIEAQQIPMNSNLNLEILVIVIVTIIVLIVYTFKYRK